MEKVKKFILVNYFYLFKNYYYLQNKFFYVIRKFINKKFGGKF